MNILFTCAGRRNYLINFFKEELENSGRVFAADMQLSAPAMADADVALLVPNIYEKNYINSILNLCTENKIDALFSLNDLELPILSDNRHLFEKQGTRVIVSDKSVIDICFDKWKTIEFLRSIDLKSPKTFLTLEDAIHSINKGILTFPLVVKPRWGSASIGIDFPDSQEELKLSYNLLSLKLQKTILARASQNDLKHAILIQEKLTGDEYGLDIVNDLEGNNITAIVKRKLAMRAGETDKAVTIDNPQIKRIGSLIGSKLKHIGNTDCDVFEKDGNYYVLELNPRFGGGYPFSHMAGANIPKAIISWIKGEKPDPDCFVVEYNKAFAKCDTLIKIQTD